MRSGETGLTRRQLLQATLGALALTGCPSGKKAARSRPIEGEIVGQDASRGHLLRSGELLGKTIAETVEVPYLIVGAGVAGLACAWRLRREGVPRPDALVLELASAPGGNAASGKNDVSPYPWGAHYLRAPTAESRGLCAFLEEIGVVKGRDSKGRLDFDTRYVCSDPVERIFEGGVWGDGLFPPRSGTAEDRAELARFRAELRALSRRRDEKGRRPFAIPVDRSARSPDLLALDRISFADWLVSPERGKSFTSRALLWLLEYGCRDDYGSTLATTSAWAGLHYHLARGLEDDAVPDDERDHGTTLVWPEGNGWLTRKLLDARGGARLETDRIVYRLEPGEPGKGASALAWDPVRGRAIRYRARRLVFAGARFLLSRLLESPPEGTADFHYVPWLAANVTLDRAPGGVGAPLSWDNVLYESPSLGYVLASRTARPDEPQVITWYHAFAESDLARSRARLFAMSWEEARDLCLADLSRAHPDIASSVRRVDVWKWGHAMIRPGPGFIWGKARERAQEPIGEVLTANSDKGGIPIFEEAFFQGALAGEEILAREGRTFTSIL